MPGFVRSHTFSILYLLSICLLACTAQSLAQDKPDKKEDDIGVIKLNTDLVSIDVKVLDRAGSRNVGGLKETDFIVYENGERQKISNFSAEDVPFNLVLLLDTSGSTQQDVSLMRRAALRFLDEMRPQDRIAIIQFNREVELLADLTSDRTKIEQSLEK